MMKQSNQVVKAIEQIIELTKTLESAILQIRKLLQDLRFEEAILLLQDVVKAIATIQKSVTPLLETLPANEINPLTKELMEGVSSFVMEYQVNNKQDMAHFITDTILPVYQSWKEELVRVLEALITSKDWNS